MVVPVMYSASCARQQQLAASGWQCNVCRCCRGRTASAVHAAALQSRGWAGCPPTRSLVDSLGQGKFPCATPSVVDVLLLQHQARWQHVHVAWQCCPQYTRGRQGLAPWEPQTHENE
jgi:hypothetical protein